MAIFRSMLGGSQTSTPIPEAVNAAPICSADAKQFGLENFGNTCYINAILQALYFCPPFRDLVISTPDNSSKGPLPVDVTSPVLPPKPPSPTPIKRRNSPAPATHASASNGELTLPTAPPTLFSALRSLFIYIAQNPHDKGKVSPSAFVNKVKAENEAFRNTNHQDAHEALNFILNKVMEELEAEEKSMSQSINGKANGTLVNGKSRKTLVHDLFEGVLTSETRCLTCETVSSRDECFLDLSIDIEPHSSVTACLRQFSASEMLCQRNKFSCDSCSGLQEAEKRMKVKKLPNVLALHLKRFKYQEESQKFIKLSYRVAFPFELRLFNTVDDAENADRLYELFAIVVHIGGGPHHGHYTTIIRSQESWFLYDDDNVESIKESDIPRYFGESSVGAGYVLFYQAPEMKTEAQPETESVAPKPGPLGGSVSNANSPEDSTAPKESVVEHSPPELKSSQKGDDVSRNIDAESPRLKHGPSEAEQHRLKHEKSLPSKLSLRYPDRSPPPIPTLPGRRPKSGGDGALGNPKNWLKAIKRPYEPPSSFPQLQDSQTVGSSALKYSHSRALSATDATPVHDVTNTNGTTSQTPKVALNDPPHQIQMARPRSAAPLPQRPSHFERSLPDPPAAVPTAPSPIAKDTPKDDALRTTNSHSRNSVPATRSTPSPESGTAQPPTSTPHNIMTPLSIKKAVRKMSLSSMPMKLAGLGRRER